MTSYRLPPTCTDWERGICLQERRGACHRGHQDKPDRAIAKNGGGKSGPRIAAADASLLCQRRRTSRPETVACRTGAAGLRTPGRAGKGLPSQPVLFCMDSAEKVVQIGDSFQRGSCGMVYWVWCRRCDGSCLQHRRYPARRAGLPPLAGRPLAYCRIITYEFSVCIIAGVY